MNLTQSSEDFFKQQSRENAHRAKFYLRCSIALALALLLAIGLLLHRNSQYVTAETNYREARDNGAAITRERDALKRTVTVKDSKLREGMDILNQAGKQLDKCAALASAVGE